MATKAPKSKKALKAKDIPVHKKHLQAAGKRKRTVRKFRERTFVSLSSVEKDELLRAVALSLHLIKEDE